MKDSFKIEFFCPRWGASDSWADFCKKVKMAGYDGVESFISFNQKEKDEALAVLKHYDLKFIGQYFQSFESEIAENAKSYERHIRHLITCNPLFINSQTGKDYFSFEQNKRLFDLAKCISEETGVKIIHETHRGKSLFAAHITQEYLTKISDLRICLDISHWCNVHESLLEDQEESIDLAIAHADHIHSRIGHQEGPQVNDPRATEWTEVLETHLAWWDKVVETHKKNGTNLTITTEFGPAPYMPALPFTKMPLANQWEINVYMMNLLKVRF